MTRPGTKYGDYAGSIATPDTTPEVEPVVLSIERHGILIDGGGIALVPGSIWDMSIPYDCTILDVTMLAEQIGSVVIDIGVVGYDNYPPTALDSICGSTPPTIVGAIKSYDDVLDGWDVNLKAGDTIRYYIQSVSVIEKVTLTLTVNKL